MNNSTEIIGARIKSLRKNNGFTQSNVANYLKVDQSLVSMSEKGSRALTSDMLDKLAALFGVQVSAFLESDAPIHPLSLALRANEISDDELEAIGAINRIALNCSFMTQLLEGEHANE